MAKKKKVEIPERKVVWHIQDDGSVSPIIQNQNQDIAPVQTKQSGFFKSSDAKNNWSIETDNPFMNAVQRANATLWGTILDAGTNVVRGATSSVEGIGDFAQNRVADVQDLFGHSKAAEKTRRKSEQVWGINQKIDDFDSIMNTTSVLGDKSDAVFQGVGTSLFAMGTGALGGAIGGTNAAASILSLGTMGLGAAGNSENQARQEMMADLKKYGFNTKQINNASRMYGLLSGVGETLSEMMFGGISQTSKVLGIGSGVFDSADDAVINALTKKLKTGIFKNFVQAGLKASGEGVEEIASGFLDAAAKKLTYMKDEDFGKLLKDENLLDSFISGTLSATITQMPSVFKSVTTRQNGKLSLKSNNEIRDFVSNLNTQEQQVVEREIENRLAQEENPTNKKRMQIEKQVIEDLDRGYISANTIRETLGDNYNPERDIRLNESFNEEARRSQSFEADLSKYEGKQKEIVQDAIESGLLNNTNKTHDMVDWVSKICADKGLDFGFTNNENIKNTGFAIDGKQVNGFIQDGKIMLNLESNQALNKTVGHEITHVLEGTDLYQNLQDSLKSFIGEREWNNRISELEKTYKGVKGANIENELTSDLVGEYVFNDESFVKNLSTRNPNLFQKIFDEIKYMVKIATAGSKEARDLEKVKRAFEKAYRETSKTQKGTQYSIQAIDDKRLYTLNDGKRKLDLSNLDTAGEKLARYINNNIRNYKDVVVDAIDGDKLTITKDTAYKIASRDNVKNTNGKMEKLSDDLYGVKLRAGMYIDELAKTSRRRGKPAPDTKNHSFAKDGFIYRDTYYMDDDGQYYKITISTGKNGEVNTIYNLGKIKETELPQVAQRPDSKTIGEAQVSTDKNISQNANNVKYSITQDSNELKQKQNDIIQQNNPLDTSLGEHTWINSADDIKTYQEALDYDEYENGNLTPDFTESMVKKALDTGKITVYSSYPIEQGTFVTPSKMEAQSYAGNSQVYSKEVSLNDVAWIDSLQGQYANVENNVKHLITKDSDGRKLTKQQQEYFKDSKVVDSKGNLQVMYRGGDQEINVFDKTKSKPSNLYGTGFYFADENMASLYGDARPYYLNIESPLYVNQETHNITKEQYSKFIKEAYKNEDYSFENYGQFNNIDELIDKLYDGRDDFKLINDVVATAMGDYRDAFDIFNKVNGTNYDGIISMSQMVVFDSNQIKNIDNTNPTSNPDIRYSLSNDEMQDLIKKEERRFNGFTVEQLDKEIGYAISSRDEMTKLSNELTKEYKELQKTDEFMKALQNYDFDSEVMQKANEYADKIRYYDNQRDKYQAQYEAINNLLMGEQKDTRTNQQIIEEAQKHFGTTDNFKEAGYITTDGNMLDFSGFHEGGQKGQRSLDHRQINEIDTDMDSFIGMGNIRILPEGGGINLEVEPTAQQYSKLRDYIDYVNDEVYIDVDKPNGTYDSARYKKGTSATKIINDIKTYFETGSFPQQSEYADFYYSLQRNNEVAPTSGWNVRSEDVRLQSAFQDTIAPLQEQVQQLTDTITRLEERIAPLSEQEADELYQETQRGFENEIAPTRENLTQEENQRLDMLDLLERNNMLTDEQRYEREQLQSKENPINLEQEVTPGQALSDIRDTKEIGSPKVKAYQYEHPEVKPYFQEEARRMLNDLDNTTSGGRYVTERTDSMYGDWHGIKRFTSPEIAALLDGEYGAKYQKEDIRKGLNAIIEDHGAENIAVAKRIELVLDERLRNGYDAWGVLDENGEQYHVAPNSEYLNMLAEQEWQNYFDDIANQYPIDDNQAQYALEQERRQEEQYKIDKSLEEMTADDINLEPFLEGLQGARERQAERQQQREEINQKKEVKIPKQSNGKRAVNRGLGLLVNEFAVLDDYSKQTKNKDIKFKTDTYNNYQAIAQSNIETAQTDINGKRIGRSGNSIFEEAKRYGLADTFDEYLKQWANVDRAKQGKGAANFSAKESYKIVKEMEAKNPRLKKLGADMWQYYRNARHNLRDAGIISQEVSDMLGRMYPHYTPYISENIENYFVKDGELKPKATIKRAKGGAAIGSLLSAEEAMQRYTKSEFNTIFGNDLFKEIVKTSNDIVQLGGDDRGMQFVNADNLYADKNGYYLTAYENGNPITAKISEDMYRTLTRESRNRISDIENTFSAVTKPLQAASNIRRNILTSWSPTFMAKNFIKDFQEGIFNSKYTKDFIKNYPSAFKELATNTEMAQQFKSLYGSGLTMGQYDIDANNYNPSGKNKNFLKGIKNVNELIELAPRYAEFKASIDHGASIQEAMYNAREVTTNFSRGGTLAKALNRNGFTFLNSSIQGFDKFIRNFSGENGAKGIVNSLAKAAIFGIAPAIFNELAFGSGEDKDEEYEALPDYIKDNYYIIKTGDGNFIRIPKGRVFSVFGSAARRTIEAMEGEENAFEGYWNNVQQQIGINNPEENNIFAPLIQAMGGRKLDSGQTAGEAWYGGDIIPSRLQKERPEDQYDASIDKFSIWLGQRTGISPYKINYVLDQYTGGIGDIGLPMITDEANSDGSIIAPIKDQFTADTTTDNKYVSEFYDTKNKLYTGSKATDEDILKSKYMNDISKQIGELYAERREVQADTTLSKKEKYEKAQAIKSEINRLAKEGLDNYEKAGITGDYANTNGQEYQKTEDGWRKLNENTSDELNLLGLTSREKNNYIKTKQNISSIKEKYKDSDDYNGKKNEIIGEIINTNLDDNSKLSLYQDTYRDKLANSINDLGINADTYLEYKAQDFSADKDKNGKSISGSKKRKVFDYINSLDIPYQQKLILAKSEYNSFNDNNAEIIEYVENSGMDYSERIELYKNLGFKVDGDNISW